MIKAHHADKDIVIIFDNSMTHKAKAPDALDAKARNLSDGGKNTTPMRDGWYINANGLRIEQPMQHTATDWCV